MLVVICAQLALVSVSWLGCFRPGILALFGPGVSSGQFILTRDCLIIPGYTARDLARAKCVRVLTVDVLAKIWRRGILGGHRLTCYFAVQQQQRRQQEAPHDPASRSTIAWRVFVASAGGRWTRCAFILINGYIFPYSGDPS